MQVVAPSSYIVQALVRILSYLELWNVSSLRGGGAKPDDEAIS